VDGIQDWEIITHVDLDVLQPAERTQNKRILSTCDK